MKGQIQPAEQTMNRDELRAHLHSLYKLGMIKRSERDRLLSKYDNGWLVNVHRITDQQTSVQTTITFSLTYTEPIE